MNKKNHHCTAAIFILSQNNSKAMYCSLVSKPQQRCSGELPPWADYSIPTPTLSCASSRSGGGFYPNGPLDQIAGVGKCESRSNSSACVQNVCALSPMARLIYSSVNLNSVNGSTIEDIVAFHNSDVCPSAVISVGTAERLFEDQGVPQGIFVLPNPNDPTLYKVNAFFWQYPSNAYIAKEFGPNIIWCLKLFC